MKTTQLAIIPVGLPQPTDIVEISIDEPLAWLSSAALEELKANIIHDVHVDSVQRFKHYVGDVLNVMGMFKRIEGVHEALKYTRLFVKEQVTIDAEFGEITQWLISYAGALDEHN